MGLATPTPLHVELYDHARWSISLKSQPLRAVQQGSRCYSQSSILCTSPRSPKWEKQGAGNRRQPAGSSHPVPDYELDFISKGTNSPEEAILFAVGEEEDETPHDWQMLFYGANGNRVGSSPFLHAILKLAKRSPAHIPIAVKLRFLININARKRGNCTSSRGTEKRKGTPLPLTIKIMTRRTWLRSDVGEKFV